MMIQGLQKMTLLDYPEKVACTVFLGGCDFRCPFCHNYDLATKPGSAIMEESAFFAFLEKRQGLLDGVVVTGGEPCLRKDLPGFLARVHDAGFSVKLDTNGNHPDMLARLIEDRLVDYVAMDVKNSPHKYAQTVGLPSLDLSPIETSVELLKSCGIACEFRTTVVRELHTERDFEDIGAWIRGADRYFLQPFVARDAVPDRTLSAPNSRDLSKFKSVAARYVKQVEIRGFDEQA